MKNSSTWLALLFILTQLGHAQGNDESLLSAGPARNPHHYADYGGTPDLAVPGELGLAEDEIRAILERMSVNDPAERLQAIARLKQNAGGSEQTLKKALTWKHGAGSYEMRRALLAAYRQPSKSNTLLEPLATMDPKGVAPAQGTVSALRIVALLHALDHVNTIAGQKIMIEFSPQYDGVFRLEIGRLLVARGMNVVPALIYSRSHPSSTVREYAAGWMEDLGNPLLGDQVKLKNPRRLAQLLEAYASINALEAIDLTLSFINHPSYFVRTATRRCLEKYGRNVKWPAYRMYENTFSKQPPEGAEVEQVLLELYRHFDDKRVAPMMGMFKTGLKQFKARQFKEMEDNFLQVLKKEPLFPLRNEMAPGFFAFGLQLLSRNQREEGMTKLRLADRLAEPGSQTAKAVRAELDWLAAEKMRVEGLPSLALYQAVLENNPDHSGAQKWVRVLSGQSPPLSTLIRKSILISFLVFLGISLLYIKTR